ncbi:MAG TPA: hypothetical protein VFH47_05020, partial [Candidatus Thermoplasmatota archaeon]|nr:hypothetical protein [Candidatus Thermoplasmatota archaeon]
MAGTPAGGALARALGDGFTFPMRFEPDHGRTSPGLLYRAVSTGPLMEVRDDGLHLLGPEGERIHLRVPGADWRTAAGAAPTGAYTNDLRAGVPAATLPHYAQLRFPGILPGIELVLYEAPQGGIEFDVVVSPGADPAAFRLQAAHGRWTLDGRDAVLEGAPMPLRLPAPYT